MASLYRLSKDYCDWDGNMMWPQETQPGYNHFVLWYSWPIEKCDCLWIMDELKKFGSVKCLPVCLWVYRLSRWRPLSLSGRLIHLLIYFVQALRVLLCSSERDIVVVHGHGEGLVLNWLCCRLKCRRRIVGFNWIDMSYGRASSLIELACKTKDFVPIINIPTLKNRMMEAYELKSWHGFFLPDTYDTHDQWKNPSVKQDKYIFSGGWNNRDWQLLLEVAVAMPEVHFKLVTAEYLWKKADLSAPNNVELYFDLPQLRYYEMMAGATLTVCPLKNDEVSGLINIIKSMQYGIPCIATDFGVANIYYPKAYQYGQKDSLLCQPGKVDMMRLYLLHWWQMKSDDYLVKSFELQENLRTKFAPEKEMMRLMDYLHSIGWVK